MACLRFGFTTAFNYVSRPPAKCRGDAAPFRVRGSSGRALEQRPLVTGRGKADSSRLSADVVGSVLVSILFLPLAGMAVALGEDSDADQQDGVGGFRIDGAGAA